MPKSVLSSSQTTAHDYNEQVSQLVNKAHQVAATHTISPHPPSNPLLSIYLPKLIEALDEAYTHFTQASEQDDPLPYSAEWLLDNYYIVQQALQHIAESLPEGYYRQLPKLNGGDSALSGYPRAYAIARSITIHEEGQLHLERLKRFLHAYQEITPLQMGEIWALPLMLRLTLLESVAQATGRLLGLAPLASDQTPPPIEHTADEDVIVSAAIPSLRRLDQIDWQLFFEEVSLVEQILRRDPAGIYAQMDFKTRDQYRKVVEKLAKGIPQAETTVAEAAVALAQPQGHTPTFQDKWRGLELPRTTHVGYYLLDKGYEQLKKVFNYTPPTFKRLRLWFSQHPTFTYLGPITVLTVLIIGGVVGYVTTFGASYLTLAGIALLFLIPAVTMSVSLVNWLFTHSISPRVLPKLDFREGIPTSCSTMVVIPALLSHPSDINNLFNQLELHYQRNSDPHLYFALLTDFSDAPHEHQPEDDELIAQATAKLKSLNETYERQPFYFFHRRRLWNPSEGSWMGWERKRGKLHEFNQLLRGRAETTYNVQLGDLSKLHQITYVITLDADTILSRESAPRLVGALAHPLNHAKFDPQTGRVTDGYTILQPRTEIKPTSSNQSLFTRVFAGDTGLDLYTRAVSDVYQDLFGEGTYVGKGIYNVDTFERSLSGVIPDNSLLSHDLFEGIHGRAGLVTDIVLYEDYPSHYLVNMSRSHRWIRGDWQLLPWLAPWVPSASGRVRNRLPLISLWKITDNLRRSLLAPALLLLLVLGWSVLPGSAALWTFLALLTPAVPLLTSITMGLGRWASGASWAEISPAIRDNAIRWLLFIAFILNETLLVLNAVSLTLYRLFISHKNMLQWTSAAETSRLFQDKLSAESTFVHMISAILLAIGVGVWLLLVAPTSLIVAIPLLLLWILASEIAHWIGRPDKPTAKPLTTPQRQLLHTIARRTWNFYERFVGPEDNWLPPDHFQETPRGVVAHRTSPTNVGLYLLSMLAAYDMGYISIMDFSVRLRSAFDTLDKLDRYQGHFLNWIDTSTLLPLTPRYVSTVDSGNLAGSLLVLEQGCLEMKERPLNHWPHWSGLLDTLSLLEESLAAAAPATQEASLSLKNHLATLRQKISGLVNKPAQLAAALHYLLDDWLPALDQELVTLVEDAPTVGAAQVSLWRIYARRLHNHVRHIQREYDSLLPWLKNLDQAPAYFTAEKAPTAVRQAWHQLTEFFTDIPGLDRFGDFLTDIQTITEELEQALPSDDDAATAARAWCQQLQKSLPTAKAIAQDLRQELTELAHKAAAYVSEMDFRFLYNRQRQVFHIGYNLENTLLDTSFYDLLASEARIASIIAIAKNEVPLSHWLHLGRPLVQLPEGQAVLSWSSTMFEYLMPPLFMRNYTGTLLHQSITTMVDHQISYGKQQGVPWGISESGYYAFDASSNYQYYAFGVPGLGFKRRLGDDLVITPYASLMALSIRPQAVMDNIETLKEYEMYGRYGFYEALDFTPARLPLGQTSAMVQSYMAHHQGMIMLALANYLQGEHMVARFHANPAIQSVELLLQERIPTHVPAEKELKKGEVAERTQVTHQPPQLTPWSLPAESSVPLVHYLSNGRFSTLVTNAGSGYSQWQETALTRWRADTTQEDWGSWLYVQDLESEALWSAGLQPVASKPEHYQAEFYAHKVAIQRRDHRILLQTEITVSPQDDVEIRHYSFTNGTDRPRHLRLTSYGEVVLTAASTDSRHPAFAKLFVESEYLQQFNALLFRRRPRSSEEEPRYLIHFLLAEPGQTLTGRYESDRAAFLGRGHTVRQPQALTTETWLTGRVGATLDPIMALGQELTIPPHTTKQIATVTLAAASREEALALINKYWSWGQIERTFKQAQTQTEHELLELKIDSQLLHKSQQLLSLLLFPHAVGRASAKLLTANRLGQSGLWTFGISGDYPILLVHLIDDINQELLIELIKAHIYWRRRGLKIDLVILNQQETNYGQEVHGAIYRVIHRLDSENWLNRRGGIFVLRQDQMSEAQYTLLQTAARVVLDAAQGMLENQLNDIFLQKTYLPPFFATRLPRTGQETGLPRPADLQFDNGWGGFSPDGREYIIYLRPGAETPAPWINVIANEEFGFLASESGGGYSWAINSGENRLTSWRNDPVSDQPAEVVYLRDEETAEVWSPTPQPAPAQTPYLIRHGAGYTIFEHRSHELDQQLRLFIAPDEPVKIAQLTLTNTSKRPRRLTVTYYAEWVLGTERYNNQAFITPEYSTNGYYALLAHNHYNEEFSQRVAFLSANKQPHGLTTDRTEFIGRLGSLSEPAALKRIGLQNQVTAGLDPCAAIQLHVDLPVGASETVYFLLGQGQDQAHTHTLLEKYHQLEAVTAAWEATQQQWDSILDKVTVRTPDKAMNILLNRWLLYQALACRIWGRSALYQSSGAYGFRDQLQDVMSLMHTRPDLAREHLLRSARHQFEAGDVLHWWHPPSGRGVRTRITDDLVWLPYVTAHYINSTGDETVLEEEVPFLQGPALRQHEEERYGHYEQTEQTYSLYEHCKRVLARATTSGRHGIPLMGAGDWNDGMNRVGIEGQGESIWLGWFIHTALTEFANLCARRGEAEQAAAYRDQAEAYRVAIEENGWDGSWYRRAYFDDGTPLGSKQNMECKIDSIAQSWGVLSHAADPDRAAEAMQSVMKRLVKRDERLILLFNPPFDKTPHDPGYIKGYLPGIRENGGQYTHAALWSIWAMAELGDGDTAESLYKLINPIYRADSPQKADIYKVEPYVIAADVYGVSPHEGRGGWTWYTGSSGWMYRLGLEGILGIRPTANGLCIDPCVPKAWSGFSATYQHGQTTYNIEVRNPHNVNQGVKRILVDGQPIFGRELSLHDDGETHQVEIELGEP